MPIVRLGRDHLAVRLIGAGRAFDSTGAVLWVSSSTEAHEPGSTWFGGIAIAATMDAGFPSRVGNVIQFQGTYSTALANMAWESWGVSNATGSDTGELLFKAVQQALGVKTSAQRWSLTACFSITT